MNAARVAGVAVAAPSGFAAVIGCAWWYGRKVREHLRRTAKGERT